MKFYIKLVFLFLVTLIQACSSVGQNNDSSSVGQLIIAEPLPINYKSEVAIARLSEVISRAEITDVQKAQLYYDRGVIYDSVGLRSLARLDFNLALRLKPDLVDAYNFIGIHYTQLQEFPQAYDAFDSTIELAPEHDYAYLNRGVALYYGGRAELAVEDLDYFYGKQDNDPYRVLWLYLAERDVDAVKALQNLTKRAQLVSDNNWAKDIIDLFLGDVEQNQFLRQVPRGVQSSQELTERLCEAYFYLGKYNQFAGQMNAAANFFKLSMSTNVYEFVEHRYAKLELELMRADFQSRVNAQPQN
ncbi:lipoprotein NlpI [Thalassotalea sp. PLHSN55]|uniref:lipoprotein NlpI n=1 Tax=Thalassotalea sp. PLHSN55 TaxID=3435888 RepID=UPI003F8515E4